MIRESTLQRKLRGLAPWQSCQMKSVMTKRRIFTQDVKHGNKKAENLSAEFYEEQSTGTAAFKEVQVKD